MRNVTILKTIARHAMLISKIVAVKSTRVLTVLPVNPTCNVPIRMFGKVRSRPVMIQLLFVLFVTANTATKQASFHHALCMSSNTNVRENRRVF